MNLPALIAAALGAGAVVIALVAGAAGGGGRIRRDQEPVKYWLIVGLAAGLALALLVYGLRGR